MSESLSLGERVREEERKRERERERKCAMQRMVGNTDCVSQRQRYKKK